MKFPRIALALAVSLCMATAVAQEADQAQAPQQAQAQQQLTPEQQAQLARQDADMTAAAQQVIQLIDADRIGEVWDLSTEVVKQLVTREDFVQQIASDRNTLGAPTSRGEAVVSRTQFEAGGQVPQGIYINIAFPSQFANSQQPVRELVSFRLDEDRVWRVSGYSLR